MNSRNFPWYQLIFAFVFAAILGFIYIPLESTSLPWFILIIGIPLGALVYVITESIFASLLENLKQFLGNILASIVLFLVFGSVMGVGMLVFDLLAAMIKSN